MPDETRVQVWITVDDAAALRLVRDEMPWNWEEARERITRLVAAFDAALRSTGATDTPGCGHRSPCNYNRTRYAVCDLPRGHVGDHRQGALGWTDRTMPCRVAARVVGDQVQP